MAFQMADDETMKALKAHYDPKDADAGLRVTFEMYPVENPEETAKQGRPIFSEVEYIKIVIPGDRDNVVHRPVYPNDRKRFAARYQAWKSGADQNTTVGTPLSSWPLITSAQVEELKYFHVRTVEDLAGMSDANIQKHAGLNALRGKAQDFLAAAKGAEHTTQLRAELDAAKNDREVMQRTIQEMREQMAAIQSNGFQAASAVATKASTKK